MEIVLGIVLILASVFLIVAVLLQSSKSHRLSGTIAGGAETFFGKTKGSSIDKKLSTLTTVVAIVFAVLVLVMYLVQPNVDYSGTSNNGGVVDTVDTADTADTAEGGEEVVEGGEEVVEGGEEVVEGGEENADDEK